MGVLTALKSTTAGQKAIIRVVLCFTLVVIGLVGNFNALRYLNTEAIIALLDATGVENLRLDTYSFSLRNLDFLVATQCTSIAAFLGAMALFWKASWNFSDGLLKTLQYFLVFEVLNVLRITIGLVFFDKGFSWSVTHTIPSGFLHFVLLYWALKVGGWIRSEEHKVRFTLPDSR